MASSELILISAGCPWSSGPRHPSGHHSRLSRLPPRRWDGSADSCVGRGGASERKPWANPRPGPRGFLAANWVDFGVQKPCLHEAVAAPVKSGTFDVCKPIGRPRIPERTRQKIRQVYAAGDLSMRALAQRYGVSLGTVQACLLNTNGGD
jgi:hypothetical protein